MIFGTVYFVFLWDLYCTKLYFCRSQSKNREIQNIEVQLHEKCTQNYIFKTTLVSHFFLMLSFRTRTTQSETFFSEWFSIFGNVNFFTWQIPKPLTSFKLYWWSKNTFYFVQINQTAPKVLGINQTKSSHFKSAITLYSVKLPFN